MWREVREGEERRSMKVIHLRGEGKGNGEEGGGGWRGVGGKTQRRGKSKVWKEGGGRERRGKGREDGREEKVGLVREWWGEGKGIPLLSHHFSIQACQDDW